MAIITNTLPFFNPFEKGFTQNFFWNLSEGAKKRKNKNKKEKFWVKPFLKGLIKKIKEAKKSFG